MKWAIFFVLLLFLPQIVQASSQIAARDGLWLSLPPETIKCIVIRLPGDAGITAPGDYIFSLDFSDYGLVGWTIEKS